MTGQPNLVTSRRRQHELLRSWSTWAMTSILLDPSEVAHVRESGWSGTHHSDPTTGERIAGTTDGLGFGLDESWHNPRELIAWPDIEAIAESVPTEVREQLVELLGVVESVLASDLWARAQRAERVMRCHPYRFL